MIARRHDPISLALFVVIWTGYIATQTADPTIWAITSDKRFESARNSHYFLIISATDIYDVPSRQYALPSFDPSRSLRRG